MLVGLNGYAGAGKDTAFKLLRDEVHTGLPVRRDAFADRLKVSAARALGVKGDEQTCIDFCNSLKQEDATVRSSVPYFEHDGDWYEGLTISGREYLQYYGTEAHREVFGQDFWIEAVLPKNLNHISELLVVTDVRFPNEAEAIRDRGGCVWLIDRRSAAKDDAHASERPLEPHLIDRVIDNNGTLDDLADELGDGLVDPVDAGTVERYHRELLYV